MLKTIINGKEVYVESPIHIAFGLTYASYLCIPRLVLQEMPLEWQEKFVNLMNDLPDTPVYSCQRRDQKGRFIKDEFQNYRRGRLPEDILSHIEKLND